MVLTRPEPALAGLRGPMGLRERDEGGERVRAMSMRVCGAAGGGQRDMEERTKGSRRLRAAEWTWTGVMVMAPWEAPPSRPS